MTFSWKSINMYTNMEDTIRFLMELKSKVFSDMTYGDIIKEFYQLPYKTNEGLIIFESKDPNVQELQYQLGFEKVSTDKVYQSIIDKVKYQLQDHIQLVKQPDYESLMFSLTINEENDVRDEYKLVAIRK